MMRPDAPSPTIAYRESSEQASIRGGLDQGLDGIGWIERYRLSEIHIRITAESSFVNGIDEITSEFTCGISSFHAGAHCNMNDPTCPETAQLNQVANCEVADWMDH